MKFLLVVLLAVPLFAQTAVVVELPKCDADRAKALYQAKEKADNEWAEFVKQISASHRLADFEFSKDFRFVVPTPHAVSGNCTIQWGSGSYNPCLTSGTINVAPLTLGNWSTN